MLTTTNIGKTEMVQNMLNSEPLYTISTAAKLLGISVQTLRMYEKEGLIIPFKKTSNQRLYSDEDVERIRCIRKTINEDKISINGIKTILSLIPCWKITNCSEDGEACQAFSEHRNPCWTLQKKNNFCLDVECRECEVYRNFGNCGMIKTKIRDLTHAINSMKD
jgi:MerR family transcriptional regulator/heat shock protein HspR